MADGKPITSRARLTSVTARCHIQPIPPPDLTEKEYAEVVRLVRAAIDAEPYRIGPRISKLRRLLAKLDPATETPAITSYPPPLPSAAPSRASSVPS